MQTKLLVWVWIARFFLCVNHWTDWLGMVGSAGNNGYAEWKRKRNGKEMINK